MTLSEAITNMFSKVASSPAQRAVASGAPSATENPTDGQKRVGNYRKVHLNIDGFSISIENPKGSYRSGTSPDGTKWRNMLACDYGDIRGTESTDGDPVDIYLSDHPEKGAVFVIDQIDPKTKKFDEHKVMYGFDSVEDAKKTYLACYQAGWGGLGWITPVTKAEFRKWIDSSGRKTKPFHEYKSVTPIVSSIKIAEDGKVELRDGSYEDVMRVVNGLSEKDKARIVRPGGTFRDVPGRLAGRTVAYEGDTPVGFVDVYGVDNNGVVTPSPAMVIAIDEKARGRGLSKVMSDDVIKKVLDRVNKTRNDLGKDRFKRLVWRLHKDNDASASAASNAGFHEQEFKAPHRFRQFELKRDEIEKNAQAKQDDPNATQTDDDIDESVIVRFDDDKHNKHGYVRAYDGELSLTNNKDDALVFQHDELAQTKIEIYCADGGYKPECFEIISVDPRADEPYDESELDKEAQSKDDDQMEGVPAGVKLRSFIDAPATRTAIMDNVLEAVKNRFPIEDDDVRLELKDVKYEGPTSYTLEQQKQALLGNRRLGCSIAGTWRLTDKKTGQVLDERRDGIIRVPYYTDRGTIINNGNEYTVISQARLSPGVYVRRKQNGELESQFNVANGLGFRIGLNKETGALNMSIGQGHVPLYPVLRALGVSDEDIRKSWGDEVTSVNAGKFDPRAEGVRSLRRPQGRSQPPSY